MEMALEIPPCVKNESDKPQCAQTYVLKLVCNESKDTAVDWLRARITEGAGVAAMVGVYTFGANHGNDAENGAGFYLVVTENAAHRDS